ncbi:MAG: hypothetical protein AAGG46_11385 [Planctomycetota bacterium]
MRLLFAAIGYLSVATVMSLVLGVGYLWQSERLDDEKMFHIVALLHGIDLSEVAAAEESVDEQEAPPEEMSLQQSRVMRQIVERDQEVKEAALRRGRQEFEYWFGKFKDERDKLDRIALQIQQLLSEQGEELQRESIDSVVRDLESIDARVAKDQLQRTLKEQNGIETVIMLMNAMDAEKLKKILKTFVEEDDKADLHLIHQEMLKGGPQKELFDSYLDEIEGLDRGG